MYTFSSEIFLDLVSIGKTSEWRDFMNLLSYTDHSDLYCQMLKDTVFRVAQ